MIETFFLLVTMFFFRTARSLVPKSSYYFGPPGPGSAYGTRPIGQIGLHHPREILRIERDYSSGELTQFAPIYPLELEGRVRVSLTTLTSGGFFLILLCAALTETVL